MAAQLLGQLIHRKPAAVHFFLIDLSLFDEKARLSEKRRAQLLAAQHHAREDQFETEAEAQAYLDENNIMFSLSFGPVMVENGVDVTPYDYPLGEIRDTYARCAIGQLGKLHYLAMTINCQSPDYYVYVTLRQAADSMIAHGCYNAYTLDGGQTGSIIIGNELINPVQFGVERRMSDIFYFATAIPEN